MTGFESFNWACLSLARGTGHWGKGRDARSALHQHKPSRLTFHRCELSFETKTRLADRFSPLPSQREYDYE